MEGHVYILINSSFPKLVKIGRTSKTPQSRAQELSGTGTPSRFVVAYSVLVNNCIEVEAELHSFFSSQRHTSDREFFELESTTAINKLIEITKDIIISDAVEAETNSIVEFATFYLLKVHKNKHLYRVGLVQSPKSYLEDPDFKAIIVDLYLQYDSDLFYTGEILEAAEFFDIDQEGFDKMRELIDQNLSRLKLLNLSLLDFGKYDSRTFMLKVINESFPQKVYLSTLPLLETVAKDSAYRKSEKLRAIKKVKENAERTKLLDEKLRRIERIKKSGI